MESLSPHIVDMVKLMAAALDSFALVRELEQPVLPRHGAEEADGCQSCAAALSTMASSPVSAPLREGKGMRE